jgi:hypothetical protein
LTHIVTRLARAFGRCVVTGGIRSQLDRPLRWCYAVTLLAAWADKLAGSVRTPARSERSRPVVRLAERGRVRETPDAVPHVTAGGR